MKRPLKASAVCLAALSLGLLACFAQSTETGQLRLPERATVDSTGVFVDEIISSGGSSPLPHVRLGDAPRLGQSATFTRAQVAAALVGQVPEMTRTNLAGASAIVVARRVRTFGDIELKEVLTKTLQRDVVKDRGDLELRVARPWTTINVPDEPLTLRVVELPTAGVTPSFVARFELRTATETVGSWQVALTAHVWREIWVAQSPLRRGVTVRDADLSRERRDALTLRDGLAELSADDTTREFTESVPAGTPVYARSLRLRAVVRRGKIIDAIVEDSSISITARAEVLEDGAPGQIVRLRNIKSRREFKGKVKDEETVIVAL